MHFYLPALLKLFYRLVIVPRSRLCKCTDIFSYSEVKSNNTKWKGNLLLLLDIWPWTSQMPEWRKIVEYYIFTLEQCRIQDENTWDISNKLFVCVLTEHHPIEYAIDGTNRWWQSPSIKNGMEYHYVTITLDLKQVENTHSLWVKCCLHTFTACLFSVLFIYLYWTGLLVFISLHHQI